MLLERYVDRHGEDALSRHVADVLMNHWLLALTVPGQESEAEAERSRVGAIVRQARRAAAPVTDVLVVGAGLAGLAAARDLAPGRGRRASCSRPATGPAAGSSRRRFPTAGSSSSAAS